MRQSLLTDLLEHYQTLLAESSDTPSLRANRAVTSTKIASIYRDAGDLGAALEAYRSAQFDFQHLFDGAELASDDSRHLYRSELAVCLSNTSIVLLELGRLSEAKVSIDDAIRLQEALVRSRDELKDQISLATSYTHRGTIECKRELRAGIGSFVKAAEVVQQAETRFAETGTLNDALPTVAIIYGILSSQLRNLDLPLAIQYGRRAVDCSRRLVDLDATKSDAQQQKFRTKLATSSNNLATLYVQHQKPAQAVGLYRDAARQLRENDDDASLVVTLSNMAKVQNRLKSYDEAAESYGEAIGVQAALLRHSPANLNYVSRLGGLQNNLAFVCQRNGDIESACAAYDYAIEYQRRAFELAPPQVVAYRDALSRTYFNASRAELMNGNPLRAAEHQLRRSKLWPSDSGQLFSVATSLATIVKQISDKDEQHNWRNVALGTLRNAIDIDSSQQIDRRQATDLAVLLQSLGNPADTDSVGSDRQ